MFLKVMFDIFVSSYGVFKQHINTLPLLLLVNKVVGGIRPRQFKYVRKKKKDEQNHKAMYYCIIKNQMSERCS